MTPLAPLLADHALIELGRCALTQNADGLAGTLVMVGPDEPAFWPQFAQSSEMLDGAPNPMDRWSRRVLMDLAESTGSSAIFPFGGPPFQPFFTWAIRTGRFWSSPIGFLVHDTAGLFVSFRGALLFDDLPFGSPSPQRPCDTCAGQPCKTACPVDAFADGYDVAACKAYLRSSPGADCMTRGCLARRACPVSQNPRLPEQAAFHMKAFL